MTRTSKKSLGLLLASLLLMGVAFFLRSRPPALDEARIKESALIPYPAEFNYRQTVNDCAPFNAAAVVRALTGEEADSARFAEEIGWRLPNRYTLPWGLEKQLKENGIAVQTPNVKGFSDPEKLAYLRQELSQGRPVVVLGEREGYEHYLTLFGFDQAKDEFYAYDSFQPKAAEGMTADGNGDLPGNLTLASQELLEFWHGSGMVGLYKWYTLVTG